MILNILFGIFYLIVGNTTDPIFLLQILIFHCVVGLLVQFSTEKQFVTPIHLLYIIIAYISYCNISLIKSVGTLRNTAYRIISVEYLEPAAQLWCIGCTALIVGHFAGKGTSFPKINYQLKENQIDTFYKFSLILTLVSPFTSGLGALGAFYKIIILLGIVGLLFFSRLWSITGEKKFQNYTLVLFATQTVVAIFTSYLRFSLVSPAIIAMVGYFSGKKSVQDLLSAKLIPFVVILIWFSTSFSTLGGYRANFSKAIFKQIETPDKANDNNLLADNELDEGEEEEEEDGGSLQIRLSTLTQLTNIIKLTETNGFYNGQASAPLITALVPRFLWPDKPNIELGLWFALEIGAAYKAENSRGNNSVNMTPMGELYLDFGMVGAIIGCILLGVFSSAMWNASMFYTGSVLNILGIVLGGYTLLNALYMPSVDLQSLITFISYYLIFIVLNRTVLKPVTEKVVKIRKWTLTSLSR